MASTEGRYCCSEFYVARKYVPQAGSLARPHSLSTEIADSAATVLLDHYGLSGSLSRRKSFG